MADDDGGGPSRDPFFIPDYEPKRPSALARFRTWFVHFFKQRVPLTITIGIITAGVVYWSGDDWSSRNWLVPLLGAPVIFFTILAIWRKVVQEGSFLIIECRVQGQIITWCDHPAYRGEPLKMPVDRLHIWEIPNSYKERMFEYGDKRPLLPSDSIMFADFVDFTEDGSLVVVHAEDGNFHNAAMFARVNPELAEAMHEIGRQIDSQETMEDLVVDAYERGKLGKIRCLSCPQTWRLSQEDLAKKHAQALRHVTWEVSPEEERNRALQKLDEIKMVLGNTAAAKRDIFRWWAINYPALQKTILMQHMHFESRVFAEIAKWLSFYVGSPVGREQLDVIQKFSATPQSYDFDAMVKKMLDEARKKERVKAQPVHKPVGEGLQITAGA